MSFGRYRSEQILELVDLRSRHVPSNQFGTGSAERLNRPEITGAIDDDRIAGIDEASGEQIEALLRAGENQHALSRHTKPFGDRLAQHRLAFGRAMTPDRIGVALQCMIDRLLKRRGRKAIDGGFAGSERQEPRVG